jgi:ArsR family transcriptional regulator
MKEEYIQFLGTLAHENRINILLALKEKTMNVSELIKTLNLNQTTISHNLKRLQICGFVHVKQNGKYREYSVNKETIKPLIALIEKHMKKYCCHVISDKTISKKYKTKKLT